MSFYPGTILFLRLLHPPMFSRTCSYAIKAMLVIHKATSEGRRVGLKEIADEIGSPAPFTAKILQHLAPAGLVRSFRGRHGGFEAARPTITLGTVVEAIDGDRFLNACILGFDHCSSAVPCPLHSEFRSVRSELRTTLNDTTLADLSRRLDQGGSFLKQP